MCQLEKLRCIEIVVHTLYFYILRWGKVCLNWYNNKVTFFFVLILHEMLLHFFYYPLGGFFLSLFSNCNRPIPFSWALPHQGQLILCKTGPKIRNLGRQKGGAMAVSATEEDYSYKFLKPREGLPGTQLYIKNCCIT